MQENRVFSKKKYPNYDWPPSNQMPYTDQISEIESELPSSISIMVFTNYFSEGERVCFNYCYCTRYSSIHNETQVLIRLYSEFFITQYNGIFTMQEVIHVNVPNFLILWKSQKLCSLWLKSYILDNFVEKNRLISRLWKIFVFFV